VKQFIEIAGDKLPHPDFVMERRKGLGLFQRKNLCNQ
jgi:hypothetical protein